MKLNFYEDLEQMEYIRKFNENKNKNKKQWRNIMIDELNWNCSIERMICYFIEANRKIFSQIHKRRIIIIFKIKSLRKLI